LYGALDLAAGSVSRAAVLVVAGPTPAVVASTSEPVHHPSVESATAEALAALVAMEHRPPALKCDNLLVVPVGTLGQWLGALVLEVDGTLADPTQEALTWLVSTVAVILDSLVTARRLRSLVRHASDALVVVTPEGLVRYCAPSLERTFGYNAEQTAGSPLSEIVHPQDLARLLRALEPPIAPDGSAVVARWRHADGSWRDTETIVADMLDDPEVEGIVLAVRDVTERRALEMELRNAQKLRAVGQLAGGVAHEINTPVQFIADNLQFLQEAFATLLGALEASRRDAGQVGQPGGGASSGTELTAVDQAAELEYLEAEVPSALAQALEGTHRVAKIVRALKAFGYPDRGQPVATDINDSLRNTLIVARGELKYVAEVVEELGELPSVMVVPGDIGQVFLNIVVNAAHAVAEKVKGTDERGHITVKTWCEGDEVVVSIADDGAGIPEEVAQRIFEPFFTTKEQGKGTGQGLALSRSVLEAHGGSVHFASTVGEGTTFVIRLPVQGTRGREPAADLGADYARA
jgi:PAS domain S-box-containing protein